MSRPQRRKHFIDAHVQGALVRRIIFHWAVFLSVAFVVSFLLQAISNPFRPLGEQMRDLWYTHGPFLVVTIFLLPVFIVDTIKISHRFAGPIFNLRRAIREAASGETPRLIKFRNNDFWHELAEDYNALVKRFAPEAASGESAGEEAKPASPALTTASK